jgi:ATPase subunit of ABC transporter with duplicated ATPase domains
MAAPRSTFTKRQKERARQEKQAEKAQKRAQRKQEQQDTPVPRGDGNPTITYDEDGQPQALDFHDF